ncbi:hypothetical protein OT109_00560 [Phycisphaeraceae bacterium D3-23]
MTTKPLHKQVPFEKIKIRVSSSVIRVVSDQRGEWLAFWGLAVLIAGLSVPGWRLYHSPATDDVARVMLLVFGGVFMGLPLTWAIGWRLAFRQTLWLYPLEGVAEYRWVWHRWTYRSTWIDLAGGEMEIAGRRMQVRGDEQHLGGIVALGCLSALLGPVGVFATLALYMGSKGKKKNKRVPVLAASFGDDRLLPIALFSKNREARQVLRAWQREIGAEPQ